jgi:putative DNA primase/helicase
MDELLKWLKENNFNIDVPDCDGKIHRFDRDGKKNAWFWGVRLHATKSGQEYIIAKVGDWKTDEEFDFKTNTALTREDKKIIQTNVKEAQEKAARAKEALHADASEIATAIMAGARGTGPTEYMRVKNIPELFGARVTKQSAIDHRTGRKSGWGGNDDVLVVPMRDTNGRLWGVQQITWRPDKNKSDKYFITGQRKQGCYLSIPEDADLLSTEPVYLCEGFATGVSLHKATHQVVIVAFDAGNLLSVAQAIRAEAPDKPIIICGDDDVWGRRPDGSPYNAGREKGTEAATAVLGRVVFPRFRSEEGKPTDWNDLELREGLEEVKRQILEVKPERHYVRCLGHREGSYFYTSSDNKEIVGMRAHGPSELMNLMPLAYWETLYPSKRGIDWQRAADELMRKCRERGIFWPDNIRGAGVWEDNGRIVVHLGDRLYVDGTEIGIHDLHSQYIYALGPSCRSVHKSPLSLAECAPIHELMSLVSFERSEQRFFLAGWIMAARLSGMLRWRPQMWITGESGSGKSTLLQQFVFPMLGDQRKQFAGGTTEAGMRQAIKADAVPVVFDEFEPDSPEAVQRVKSCLEFIRQASTDSGHIVKGSTGGESMQFKARFCAAVSAIRTLLNTQADRTRFTLVELKMVHHATDKWDQVQRALAAFTPEYADRYFARLLHMLPVIQKNMAAFSKAFAAHHNQRLGQQYGPLLAGWAAIIADTELSPEEVEDLVDQVDLNQEGAASGETDQRDCLQHLLQRQVSISVKDGYREEITVARLIEEARFHENFARELARFGMRVVVSKGPVGEGVFISNRNPQLSQLFRDSSWASGWTGSLGRLPGARRNHVACFDKHSVRGLLVPLKEIFSGAGEQEVFDPFQG